VGEKGRERKREREEIKRSRIKGEREKGRKGEEEIMYL